MEKNIEEDNYLTIEGIKREEIKVKGSKFIASAGYAPDKNKAMEFVGLIRSEFFDATHNCFAYSIGAKGLEYRFFDDGEPSGSAGKPILFTINKFNYKDIVLVVTRYFGGTKLGIGGLSRAYSDAANEVLSKCKVKKVHLTTTVKVFCIYEDINVIKRLISEYAISFEESYLEAVEFIVQVPNSKAERFAELVSSQTKGRAGAVINS